MRVKNKSSCLHSVGFSSDVKTTRSGKERSLFLMVLVQVKILRGEDAEKLELLHIAVGM